MTDIRQFEPYISEEGTWDHSYRRLEKGEVIQAGDEVDSCANPWHDDVKWEPVPEHMIGLQASDPNCIAHSIFRRKKGEAHDL